MTSLAVACSSGSNEEPELSASSDGMRQIDSLLDSGDRGQATAVFSQVHQPMHATANRLAPVDSEGAEVVNDITEALDLTFRNPNAELTTLNELTHKAIQFLDEARYQLG